MEIRTIAESWVPLFLKASQKEFDLFEYWWIFEFGGFVGSLVSGVMIQLLQRVISKERSRFIVASVSTFLLLLFSVGIFSRPVYKFTSEISHFRTSIENFRLSLDSMFTLRLMSGESSRRN